MGWKIRDICTAQSQVTKDVESGTPINRKVIWTQDLSGVFERRGIHSDPSCIEVLLLGHPARFLISLCSDLSGSQKKGNKHKIQAAPSGAG